MRSLKQSDRGARGGGAAGVSGFPALERLGRRKAAGQRNSLQNGTTIGGGV